MDLGSFFNAMGIAKKEYSRSLEPVCKRFGLTQKGEEIAEAGAGRQRQFFEALYTGISPAEREQLRAISRKIMDNILHFDCVSAK